MSPGTSFDPMFVWLAVACIATLFAHSAWSKLADLGRFRQHLAAYRVPGRAGWPLALVLSLTEAAVAALLLGPWREVGALLGVAVLTFYAGAMAWQLWHGRQPDCGCGGDVLPVSWWLVARNLALAAIALFAALPMGTRAMNGFDFAVITAALGVALLLWVAAHQLLRHRAPLAPGLWRT